MRTQAEILQSFFEAAWAARDDAFYAQAERRKEYLTREVIERWKIGKSPTLKQARKAGLTELELREVGLLRDPVRDGPDQKPYMFFRKSMVFPFMQGNEIVYASSRRLVDVDRDGVPLDKSKKALCMPGPDGKNRRGVQRLAGFNLNLLQSLDENEHLLVVEGVLDAIACSERGHPAVAIVGGSMRGDLAMMLAGRDVFLALDGTADVTEMSMLIEASRLGPDTGVCVLPAGKDPDDLDGLKLQQLKADAKTAFECWMEILMRPEKDWPKGVTTDFGAALRSWNLGHDKVQVMQKQIRERLGLSASEFVALIHKGDLRAAPPAAPPKDEKKEYLDAKLARSIGVICSLSGTDRDDATCRMFRELAFALGTSKSVTRERVRDEVCKRLAMRARAYDQALREAYEQLAQEGVMKSSDLDWAGVARGFLMRVRECCGVRVAS